MEIRSITDGIPLCFLQLLGQILLRVATVAIVAKENSDIHVLQMFPRVLQFLHGAIPLERMTSLALFDLSA